MSRPLFNLAGVCGWPIHHSLSPLIHNYWLKEMGLKGAYVHFAVRPDEAVSAFKSLKRTSISGVNVTLPLKGLAFESADERTSDAQRLGVANCLFKRNGNLVAHNTDLEGFAAPLVQKTDIRVLTNNPSLVIGTGGAARAVIGALLSLGVPEIRICGRTDQYAKDLASDIDLPSLYAIPWAERKNAVVGTSLIVNASAGGMTGKPALSFDLSNAGSEALVYDLIYTPRVTPLLKQAENLGLKTLGGLEMLIAQARPSFKHFYGETPPIELDPTSLILEALEKNRLRKKDQEAA